MAKTYGRTIISELFLPESERTIKPADIGGVAGGKKYLVRGILFKLAKDAPINSNATKFLYGSDIGPNDEFAAKGAGHDLKGVIGYFKYFSMGLRVPMQALVDFRGFRLVAMPYLPLQNMVYGSSDGGRTLLMENEQFNSIMKEAANSLHLSGHFISNYYLYSAGDVEGYSGSDGRNYLLDLARTYPPESPEVTKHLPIYSQSIFFRLLRPEFLQILKSSKFPPLSPDALAGLFLVFFNLLIVGWSRNASDMIEMNERVKMATRVLLEIIIPEFAQKLNEMPLGSIKNYRMSENLHRHGINVRHLSLIRSLVTNPVASEIILVEMVSRTLKNLLRFYLRYEMQRLKEASEYVHRELIVQFLNKVSGATKCPEFWNHEVRLGLFARFGCLGWNENDGSQLYNTVQSRVVDGLHLI